MVLNHNRDSKGLDRFFPAIKPPNGATNLPSNPTVASLEDLRSKFRLVVTNLMQDDEFVDKFIVGFKKAGLDIS